jgi:hypothetical protein
MSADPEPASPYTAGKTLDQNGARNFAAGGPRVFTGVGIGEAKRKSRLNGD